MSILIKSSCCIDREYALLINLQLIASTPVRKKYLILVLLVFTSLSAHSFSSQDPLNTFQCISSSAYCCLESTPKSLDLWSAIDTALSNNPDTHIAWLNLKSNAGKLGSAKSVYLPSINLNVNYSDNYRRSSFGSTYNQLFNPVLTLDYLIYDFGGRAATVDAAQQTLIASQYFYDFTVQSILFSTIQAYYNYFQALATVDAADATLKSSQATMDAATLKHKVGNVALLDQLQAQTAYSQAKLQKIQAENTAAINKGILLSTLGLDSNQDISLPVFIINTKKLDHDFNQVNDLIALAKEKRPDLMEANAQAASSLATLEATKAQNYPKLSLGASAQSNNYLSGSASFINNRQASLTMNAALPLFTGFNNYYQIRTAQENYRAQIYNLKKTELAIVQDVWASYQNLLTAKESLTVTEELLETAIQAENVALASYKAGTKNIIDLLNAQTQLASARQQRINAEYQWLISKNNIIRAIGIINTQNIEKFN